MDLDYLGHSAVEFRNLVDAVLIVQDTDLPVHKAILAVGSPEFAKLFESCSSAASANLEGLIRIPLDDNLQDVRIALKYIYQGCTAGSSLQIRMTSHNDAWALAKFAHKYNMKRLLEECEVYIVDHVAKLKSSVSAV